MKIEQLYTGCLAEAAYYIESEGEVAIIDPLRETEPYIEMAEKEGASIKYIFETHFHADFVSGHVDLARKTGASIVYGPTASPGYDAIIALDEEEFRIGKIIIRVLHTPGHTMESSTYLLLDENGKEVAIFTGDTLFIGDVGRPDLAVKSDVSQADLAGFLYDSLRNKIMVLPDDITVYPAHGAGSACGKNMSKETFDTLGNQKKVNYALRANMTKKEFIAEVTEGILPPPQYFAKNAALNKNGYGSYDEVLEQGLSELSVEEFKKLSQQPKAVILDVRNQADFLPEFIPNSIFVGLNGMFAIWVGTLIKDLETPILLISPEGKEKEAVTRLSRVGYDNVLGFLKGGVSAWKAAGNEVDFIKSVNPEELENAFNNDHDISIVDVRKPGEYSAEHLEKAISFPLDYINGHLNDLDKSKEYYIHCAGGYRSVIAASILRREGYRNIIDVDGGFASIKNTSLPVTNFVCPSTLTAK